MDDLSAISLVWLLYLETEPIRNWPIREMIESIAETRIERFFAYYFPSPLALNFSANAIHTLIHTRLDMSERDLNGYGFVEDITNWPIIPKALLDSISEKNLFYPFELKMLQPNRQ